MFVWSKSNEQIKILEMLGYEDVLQRMREHANKHKFWFEKQK